MTSEPALAQVVQIGDAEIRRNIERRGRLWKTTAAETDRLTKLALAAGKYLIGPESCPAEPVARFLIAGKPVCTPGNLTNILGQSKSGKSSFIAAMMAARFAAESGVEPGDCLGVSCPNDQAGLLIHVDTEQTAFDLNALIRQAVSRANVGQRPDTYRPYSMAGVPAAELKATLEGLVYYHLLDGIHSVILDGTADFLVDVNDAREANAFVAWLHSLAIKADCPIIGVVHENPGGNSGKMRGHLGSQLERKSESNIRLCPNYQIVDVR